MSYIKAIILILVIGLPGLAAAAQSESSAVSVDAITRVEAAYQGGRISLDEKAQLQITAIVDPESLPAEYQSTEGVVGGYALYSATPTIIDIKQNWSALSPRTREFITLSLARPTASFIYVAPSGFFTLHYDLSGADSVPSADNDLSGYPDFVERCAAYLDTSLTLHRDLGYLDPPIDLGGGGDNTYDVYFKDMIYYGYVTPEGPGPAAWNDEYSFMMLNSTFTGFPPNEDPEGDVIGAAKATAAHEYHHAVQLAYDGSEPIWLMEIDAVYIEDLVFDHVNDQYNYLDDFMDAPGTSLMAGGMHAYASFIWELFLAQQFDTSLMVSMWEGGRYDDAFDALADTLEGVYGWSRDSAFVEFTSWNFMTGSRDDGLHHEEAAAYDEVAISATHSHYPINIGLAAGQPQGYGASYVQFFPEGDRGMLDITFDGSDDREWAAYVIKSPAIDMHATEIIPLSPSTWEGTLSVPDFRSYHSVTLVAVNTEEFSSAGTFSYTATMRIPDLVRGEILSDTAAYAGETRLFDYRIVSLSDQAEVFEIHGWDDSAWIDSGHVDSYLAAGDSAVIQIGVSPDAASLIDSRSQLNFRVQLKTDPTNFDQQSITAVIVPKRGDVNRSGKITLSDITFLISHLYMKTAAPMPWWLGDYNCSEKVTLSDISQLINRVFMHGQDSACDPYVK